jgi:ribosomal protein S3
LLTKYLATQFQILKHHNFFFRFIKSALILLNNKVFFSKIQGIKIQIKGRFNGNPRTKTRIIKVSKIPPFLTKSSNIEHFENTSFSNNGTFGIKV